MSPEHEQKLMDVTIVDFPETKVAVIEHRGPPSTEHASVQKLVAWKLEQGLVNPVRHRSFGVHHTDPRTTPPSDHHVDFCLSIDRPVGRNSYGIVEGTIPANRCALARDLGSRFDNRAAAYLYEAWLSNSSETPGNFPIFFHYVNVGPRILPKDMITDVYLPLR